VTRPFSLHSARDFTTNDYRRWAVGAAFVASLSYSVMAAISIWQSGVRGPQSSPVLSAAAICCWIGLGFALRGWSSLGVWLILTTAWLEMLFGYTVSRSFPAPGMLTTAALVAATTLLAGPRPALVITVASLAITPILLLRSPALVAGFPDDAVYWLVLQGAVALAMWGLVSLSVVTLGRMFFESSERESRVAETLRTEAIGELAAGVAHDFNNLLTAVGGSAELLRDELANHPHVGLLDDILAAQQRGTTLTRQLLAFARRDVIDPRVFDLSAQVAEVQRLLQRVAGEQTRLFCDLTPDCRVRADVGRIELALVSLVANARDAMPAGGECAIRVRPARGADGVEMVVVEVTDSGVGMEPAVVERAFDPFFTTRTRGRGTGLGLASVRGIIEQSGGRASISSEPRVGTIVTLELPRSFEPLSPLHPVNPPVRSVLSRGMTILVADDDDGTRAIVDMILRRAGFTVVLAPDGVQALRLIQRATVPIDLVVTDVMMPGLTGPKLAAKARTIRPELPILFMSGYPEDALGEVPDLDVTRDFIAKPFGRDALLARVGVLLGGTKAT